MLDSALIANIQHGNIEAAYEVLDLSSTSPSRWKGPPSTEHEGKIILSKVKAAMKQGDLASA